MIVSKLQEQMYSHRFLYRELYPWIIWSDSSQRPLLFHRGKSYFMRGFMLFEAFKGNSPIAFVSGQDSGASEWSHLCEEGVYDVKIGKMSKLTTVLSTEVQEATQIIFLLTLHFFNALINKANAVPPHACPWFGSGTLLESCRGADPVCRHPEKCLAAGICCSWGSVSHLSPTAMRLVCWGAALKVKRQAVNGNLCTCRSL